jgi:Trk K+ transport system NAD-binding subunit
VDAMIREKDFSSMTKDTKVQTGDTSSFLLKKEKIQYLLKVFHEQGENKNLFGYMVEINGLR